MEEISHSLRCMRPTIVLQNDGLVLPLLSQGWSLVLLQK
jgi:hypothetical protein